MEKDLVEYIVKSLVDDPSAVNVAVWKEKNPPFWNSGLRRMISAR